MRSYLTRLFLNLLIIIFFHLLLFSAVKAYGQTSSDLSYSKYLSNKKYADSLIRVCKLKAASSVLNIEKYDALYTLTIIYNWKSNFDSSYFFAKLIMTDLERNSRLEDIVFKVASSSFPVSFSKVGRYNDAIKISIKQLNYYSKVFDTLGVLNTTSQLASFYRELNLYDQNLVECRKLNDLVKSYSSIKGTKKSVFLANSYSILGDAFMMKGLYDSALYYIQESYRISKNNDSISMILPLINMAEINLKMDQPQIAIQFLLNAEKFVKAYPDNFNFDCLEFNTIYDDLAKCYEKLLNTDSSYYYYKKSYGIAYNRNRYDILLPTSLKLSDISYKNRNIDTAMGYLKKHIELLRVVASKDSILKVQTTISENMDREIKKQVDLDEQKKFRAKNIQIGVLAILVPVFTLGFYQLFRKSKRKKSNKRVIAFLSLISTLMIFEFINLLVHPILDSLTDHNVYLMYLSLIFIAVLLSPLHRFVSTKLSTNRKQMSHKNKN